MTKIRIILVLFWISILVMGLISAVSSPQDPIKEGTKQDTIKKEVNVRQMSDIERKKKEYLEWQQRSKRIDKTMETLDKQSMMMDSLLGKKDTTKIEK